MEITNELRDRADELNDRQAKILDRFPVLMALDDADRKPIVDYIMELQTNVNDMRLCDDCEHANLDVSCPPCCDCFYEHGKPGWEPVKTAKD